jgi:hypothetical protein
LTLDPYSVASMVTGAVSLLLSAAMLLVVVRVRRVAEGSAIFGNISYVVAASLCLTASILADWVDRFVGTFSAHLARTGGDVLVAVSLLLFIVYFARIGSAFNSYLKVLSSDEVLATSQGTPTEDDVA